MPKMKLSCTFKFAASHYLTDYHGECEKLHGHNYKAIITIEDEVKKDGMVMDYKKIKEIANKNVFDQLDHVHLNEIIDNPSSEHLAIYVWNKLEDKLPIKKVLIQETDQYYCEYEGE